MELRREIVQMRGLTGGSLGLAPEDALILEDALFHHFPDLSTLKITV